MSHEKQVGPSIYSIVNEKRQGLTQKKSPERDFQQEIVAKMKSG